MGQGEGDPALSSRTVVWPVKQAWCKVCGRVPFLSPVGEVGFAKPVNLSLGLHIVITWETFTMLPPDPRVLSEVVRSAAWVPG